MRVTVFGAGYVGLVTGAVLADLGHRVVLVEVSAEKIAKIRSGIAPIFEPGLQPLLQRTLAAKTLSVTDDPGSALDSDVLFIAVGTPSLPSGEADLQYVRQAALTIGSGLDADRRRVVVNKATVPIGSANLVEVWIEDGYRNRHGKPPQADWYAVASNPEFLREGSAIGDTLYPDRVVLGADRDFAVKILKALYQPILEQTFTPPQGHPRPEHCRAVPLVVTDRISAEMIKYAANAFLATKISFANEIANICEKVGADANEIMDGIGLDRRIGRRFLNTGVGWGGSCFGKDLSALIYTANEYGYEPKILEAAVAVNRDQRRRMVEKLQEELKTLKGRKVAIWGLSFKPGTDDLRDAPAVTVISELIRLGARLQVYDPIAMANTARAYPDWEIGYASSALAALEGAEALLVMTEWDEFRTIAPEAVAGAMNRAVVIDGRNLWDPKAAARAGVIYRGVGR